MTNQYQTIRCGVLEDGSTVEMRFAEFGKGRAKVSSWRFYRNGKQIGYASTPADAEENWLRVRNGMVRDDSSGNWVLR